MKLETANMKLKEAERTKDADDKLAHNRSNIGTICVDMGLDDRTSILHNGRFLPGANCSTAKLWLAARNRTPLHGAPPLGNYDMAAVGLGGFVSPRGWVELANPASTRLSLRQFNINNCARKTSSSKESDNDTNLPDFSEIGEFQLALRTLRTAAAFIMPWNFSFTALENFLINTRFCKDDLGNIENTVHGLCVVRKRLQMEGRRTISLLRRTQEYLERFLHSTSPVSLRQKGLDQDRRPVEQKTGSQAVQKAPLHRRMLQLE
jgi:hypothetical protein